MMLQMKQRMTLRRRAPLVLAIAFAAAALGMALLLFKPRADHAGRTPLVPAGRGSEGFVFAEQAHDATDYWLADAQNPSVRKLLATVSHEPNRSGGASVSPDGRWLAYTTLPPAATDPDHQAELWLLRLADGRAERVETGVDLLSFMVWSPDSASVTFGRVSAEGIELWRHSLAGKPAQLLQAAAPAQVAVPAGYDREGVALIAARLGPAGTDIVKYGASGVTVLSHTRAGSGRDFVLSPDRTRLAYLVAVSAGGQIVYQAQEVDLVTGSLSALAEPGTEDVGLAWRPNGSLTVGGVGAAPGLRAADGAAIFATAAAGFEQPLAWSPSGARLAVRQFAGARAAEPGSARDLLIEPDGARRAITSVNPVQFVGWIGE